jgi:type I restriction enzyme S subunit
MANEWARLSLSDAGVVLYDCEHKTPVDAESGYPYVAIPQMKDGHIDTSDAKLVTPDDYHQWTRRVVPRADDVLVSRRCNPGESVWVPPNLQCVVGQNLVLLRSEGTTILPEYLRWIVRGSEWWENVRSNINVGAIFDSLKCADIPNFTLPVPPIEDQRTISSFLSATDGKMVLNRQMNETLEAIARAIFRSWFIDFDPVRAKIEGRKPFGMDEETATLFPDSFEDSELGEIPKGWVVDEIQNHYLIIGGTTPKTEVVEYWGGNNPFATPKDMSTLISPILVRTERTLTDEGLAQIGSGKVPIGSFLLSSRAPIGYRAINEVEVAINQGIIVAVPKGYLTSIFILNWCAENISTIEAAANGTTFLEISKGSFKKLRIVIPSNKIATRYNEVVQDLYKKITSNVYEIATLTEIRDVLLPKLISGELRIKTE